MPQKTMGKQPGFCLSPQKPGFKQVYSETRRFFPSSLGRSPQKHPVSFSRIIVLPSPLAPGRSSMDSQLLPLAVGYQVLGEKPLGVGTWPFGGLKTEKFSVAFGWFGYCFGRVWIVVAWILFNQRGAFFWGDEKKAPWG